ncbi:MAG: DUF5011 domain-containing protein [bacterium]|nr:DUF5011 domain-containing protein [bacterium]MDY4108342.1 DUF5011 domain-containing protein [Bacilli bacterium]
MNDNNIENNLNQTNYNSNTNNSNQTSYYDTTNVNNGLGQTDYYNNDSYYQNSNYSTNNYSDTSYEEKEKKTNNWWKILLLILIILIIIILLLKFCGNSNSSSKKDEEYAMLTERICKAAEEYILSDSSLNLKAGESRIIKFRNLADKNLLETQIKNPYYSGGLFKKTEEPKYFSLDNSVRITKNGIGTYNCELVDNSKDVTAPELRLNGDATITMAVGTEFVDPGYTATDDYDGDVTSKVVVSGSVDNSKAGTYELTYTASDTAGNTTSKKRTIIFEKLGNLEISLGSIVDGVTPQISLKGSNPYCMVKGGTYIEPGATATDNVDGNITDKIAVTNKVTGNLMGAFRIVYKVEDSSGNEAIAYRAVIVTTSCPDEDSPANVVNDLPVITLIGKNSVIINVGSNYVDLGATAYDKVDGDITRKIVTDTSNVKTNVPGIYKVYYSVTNSNGKKASITRTVTVKNPISQNAAVRFTEDKKNIEVYTGEGSDKLIAAPKAVNENGSTVNVTTRIENYETKAAVSKIDWNKAAKYRVIYTAVHASGSIKQDKSIVVTIKEGKVTIGGKDSINVGVRKDNCDITEADLKKGGVTFTTKSTKAPIITIEQGKDKACKKGTYTITVIAKVDGGEETKKDITIYVVDNPNVDVSKLAPGKVQINTNSAVPYNPHNTNGVWAGGSTTAIELMFSAIPAQGTEIGHFEWSKDCKNSNEKISKGHNINEGTLSWKQAGKNEICIRAVSTDGIAGAWSDPVKLYIDRTGPTVKFTHKWADGSDDWHNTSLVVEYVAADSESGLDHYEYTYDDVMGKVGNKVTNPTTIKIDSGKLNVNEYTESARKQLFVYVRAVDKAGNVGEWTTNPAYINIDSVKPQTPTLKIEDNNTKLVYLRPIAKDNSSIRISGISKFVYTLNDGKELEYEARWSGCNPKPGLHGCAAPLDPHEYTKDTEFSAWVPITNTGDKDETYKVKIWAVDKAGNKSDGYAEDTITVKKSTPAKEVQIKNGDYEVPNGGSCTILTSYVGEKFNLVALPVPSNSDETDVTWTSSNPNVALITNPVVVNGTTGKINTTSEGNITIKSAGSTVITAKIGNAKAECVLKAETKAQLPDIYKYDIVYVAPKDNNSNKIVYFPTIKDLYAAYGDSIDTERICYYTENSDGKVLYYTDKTLDEERNINTGLNLSYESPTVYKTAEEAIAASEYKRYTIVVDENGNLVGYAPSKTETNGTYRWAGAYADEWHNFSAKDASDITVSAKAAADAKRTELESDKDKINSFKENYKKRNEDYSNEIAEKKTIEKMEEAGYKVDDILVHYNKDHAIDKITYITKDGKQHVLNDDLKNYYIEEYNKIMATIRNEDGSDGYKFSKEYQEEIESKVGEEYVSSAGQTASNIASGGKLTLTTNTSTGESSGALNYYKENGYTKENADIVSSAIKAEGDTYQNIIHSSSSTPAQKEAAKKAYSTWYKEYMT